MKTRPSHTKQQHSPIGAAVVRRPPEPRCTRKKTVKTLPRKCLKVCVEVVCGCCKRPPTRKKHFCTVETKHRGGPHAILYLFGSYSVAFGFIY
uniref:Uncharacterized protein n=1 Tax=Hyaloperonospora arabidopsidis (strain Emoy2) TaxID=559515 RepID=M4C260_HYAAE